MTYGGDSTILLTPGSYQVSVLLGQISGRNAAVAIEMHLVDDVPVRWREDNDAGWGTDAGELGIVAPVTGAWLRNAAHKDSVSVVQPYWYTPCTRFREHEPVTGRWDAITMDVGGDGGHPGAIGYDDKGRPMAYLTSTGDLPWSVFRVPGAAPPEALRDEPTD